MATQVLRLENVSAGYGKVQVLQDVNLTVDAGHIVALLGANGAGKSTLLRAISGLITLGAGNMFLFDRKITRARPYDIVKLGVGHVPEGRQPFPQLSVRENLWMGAFVRRRDGSIQRDLDMVFEFFPVLKERQKQKASLLSGGEQQMLVIGRALMSKPKLLLLDEPSLGLSPKLVLSLFSIIKRINQQQGVSVLLVEQNVTNAISISEYCYVMEMGKIVAGKVSQEFGNHDEVAKYYLGGE